MMKSEDNAVSVRQDRRESGMKVLAFNNYDMGHIRSQWEAEDRTAPSHHIWGCPELEEMGFVVEILKFRSAWFPSILQKLMKPFGDMDQQIRAWRKASAHDVIYCAHHPSAHLLALARHLGLLRKPLVAVTYQAPRLTGLKAKIYTGLFLKGYDRLLCLSDACVARYVEMGMDPDRIGRISWGFDLPFYKPVTRPERAVPDFIASGKTYRDYRSVMQGFPSRGMNLTICAAGTGLNEGIPAGKEDVIQITSENIPWRAFNDLMAQSDAVLVPLAMQELRVDNAIGLTAVLEALSLGVPVIVTRNDFLGIDIEAEGVGVWVTPSDPEGWSAALSDLAQDLPRLRAMGQRGRRLAESRLNIGEYARVLAAALVAVVPQKRS